MSRWFRFYDDAINDPKALKLSDKTYRIWVGILCIASKNEGALPPFEDMAIMLRIKPASRLQPEIEKLIAAELLDHDDQGMRPHNWDTRQYKSDVTDPTNAERQQRFRNSKRNGAVTAPVTAEQTPPKRPETETETETEQKDGANAPQVDPDADLFRRGVEVLGPSGRSLVARLKKSKGGSIPHTRAAIEQASTKANPREYIGRIVNGAGQPENDFYTNPTAGSLI